MTKKNSTNPTPAQTRKQGTDAPLLDEPLPLRDSATRPLSTGLLLDPLGGQHYRAIIEALPAAIYVCDAEARVILYNQAAVELWGRKPEIGKDQWSGSLRMFHPDGRPMPLDTCPMADAYHQGRPFAGIEAVIERPDGTRRNVLAHPQPILDPAGKMTGAINVLVDITERRQAQQALRRSEAQLEAELADTKLLQAISAQLIHEEKVESLYENILDAAVAIMRSDFASMQMFYPERGTGGELRLLAFRGFNPDAAKFWEWVRADSESTCGAALRTGRRVVAPDVEKSDFMAGSDDLATYLQTGIHAVQTTPLWSRSGKLVGMISTHWRNPHQPSERDLRLFDILARQAADLIERNLAAEAQARLAAIVQSSDDAIVSKDLNGIITSWNSAAERMFGYTPAEAIGQHIGLIIPPELQDEEHDILSRLRRGETIDHYETVRITREGRRIDLSLTISPLRDPSGRIIGAAKIARDITDRKYAEATLRESEERFRYLADHAPVLIWVNGLEGCEFVNREYLRFFGCTFNDVLDMEWSRFIHPDDAEGYLAAYLTAFQRREPFDAQLRFRRADGEYRWLRSMGAPRFTPDGTCLGYVGCSVDITDVKHSEEALKLADQRKDEFLAMLGHELRNPLAALSTGATLLREKNTEERRAWIEQMMARQIHQLQRLVDDLLDVTRISRGKIQLRRQQIDLKKHIEAAVDAVNPLVQKHRHRLTLSLPEQPVFLSADPARFEQILVNLLTNAVKYTPDGGHITLSAETFSGERSTFNVQPRTDQDVCPTSVLIRCRDTGAGLAPDALQRIFEPFVQFNTALDGADSGLGVGLALVKRLTELHGGAATAASDGPGHGSEFTVRLPLLAPEDVCPSQPMPEAAATLPAEDALRVLVVDDNLDYAEGIAILLRSAGHTVTRADNGEAALAAALQEPPDIILLDLGLPGLDGYAVAERLRSPEVSQQMKGATIVAVSGFSPKHLPQGRRNFFDAQLVKPIAHADLLGLLQEKLAARNAAVSPPLPSHRILLVEDNQEIALLTAELLRNRGLEVEVALNGADGIQKARSLQPHAVLCDLHLPDMTGFEVAQRLRAACQQDTGEGEKPAGQPPLLIAVTAFSADPLPARADCGPFDHFLSKPLDWAELSRLLASNEKKSMAVARST